MAKNETTSKRVSAVSGRILKRLETMYKRYGITNTYVVMVKDAQGFWRTIGTVDDLESICASALTQAVDKPKRERTKNAKKRSK